MRKPQLLLRPYELSLVCVFFRLFRIPRLGIKLGKSVHGIGVGRGKLQDFLKTFSSFPIVSELKVGGGKIEVQRPPFAVAGLRIGFEYLKSLDGLPG